MPKVCYKCHGMNPGCSVCNAPSKRIGGAALRATMESYPEVITVEDLWPVLGIDVSGWNGVMDFAVTMKKVQYVVVRLGYGNQWKDSRCDQYRGDLVRLGIPYFGYWYNRAGENWVAHADSFADVAAEFPGMIGYEEDFEETYVGLNETLSWIINYDNRLKSQVSLPVSPYSNYNFWATHVATNNYYLDDQWVANWTNGPYPYMPPHWIWKEGCKWQWDADGNGLAREYGMVCDGDNDMDRNRFYGSVEKFNTKYNTHIQPINPDPDPTGLFEMKCTAEFLYVREGPGIGYKAVGNLVSGDIVAVQNVGGSAAWIQIKEGPYAGKWCAVQTSKRYMVPVK